jgi:hypothetical protein
LIIAKSTFSGIVGVSLVLFITLSSCPLLYLNLFFWSLKIF